MRIYLTPKEIKNSRHEMRMTEAQFANFIGIKEQTLTKWEQGVTFPKGPYARLIQVINLHPEKCREVFLK
jgi:DNA-binding transcriptional regulator YiaG